MIHNLVHDPATDGYGIRFMLLLYSFRAILYVRQGKRKALKEGSRC